MSNYNRINLPFWRQWRRKDAAGWLARENSQGFGTGLVLVSDSSVDGRKFVKGMGGVRAFLRWKVNFEELAEFGESEDLESKRLLDQALDCATAAQSCRE
jgi:hypothetical protein